MKKIFVVAAVMLLSVSCAKKVDTDNQAISTPAIIDYLGDPAIGGFGWTLRIGSGFEIPVTLAEDYKVDELNVNVTFKKTDQTFPCRCAEKLYMVEIISISRN